MRAQASLTCGAPRGATKSYVLAIRVVRARVGSRNGRVR